LCTKSSFIHIKVNIHIIKIIEKTSCSFHSWPDNYKIGLTKKILLNINVTNTGENAYDTQCLIQLPIGVEYVSSNSSPPVRKKK
jgi:hypothetical protein